jgi:hypothetical protein
VRDRLQRIANKRFDMRQPEQIARCQILKLRLVESTQRPYGSSVSIGAARLNPARDQFILGPCQEIAQRAPGRAESIQQLKVRSIEAFPK